jgi:hypothetical protein
MELVAKNFAAPDEAREFPRGGDALVALGPAKVGRAEFMPGWRWSNDIRPIAGTASCEVAHVGYVVSGVLHVEADDGRTLDLRPGDAFTIPSGHDAWVVGDDPVVLLDWGQGTDVYALPQDEVAARQAVTR